MKTCRSCNAEIEWAISHATGRPMPVDAKPTPNGNLVVIGGVARAFTDDDARVHRERRTSHFATCPDAQKWRQS